MLDQTKENIQGIVNKLQVIDYVFNTLQTVHKEDSEAAEKLLRRSSAHKMKLLDELLRFNNVSELEVK